MKRHAAALLLRLLRVVLLIVVTGLGTIALLRFAPGYFTDEREMDGHFAGIARSGLEAQQERETTFFGMARGAFVSLAHGDLGRSRHFDLPVTDLVLPRAHQTARLAATAIVCGWLLALAVALPLSARKPGAGAGEIAIALPPALLLAVPAGAMATVCLLGGFAGPLAVLAILVAARDFKLLYRLLRQSWTSPDLLYARAQGIPAFRIISRWLLPPLGRELLALATMSLIFALSAIVPVEVVFDVPGLGQLAWTAAMNRDLPLLLAVVLLMATAIGVANLFNPAPHRSEAALCA